MVGRMRQMHALIAWTTAQSDTPEAMRAQLLACIGKLDNIEVVPDVYVVKFNTFARYERLVDKLQDVARQNPGAVRLILTPPIMGGSYRGWLPTSRWATIRTLTGRKPKDSPE